MRGSEWMRESEWMSVRLSEWLRESEWMSEDECKIK